MADVLDGLHISIDEPLSHEHIFDGTIEQFRNCFFSDATAEKIILWAVDNNFTATFADWRRVWV